MCKSLTKEQKIAGLAGLAVLVIVLVVVAVVFVYSSKPAYNQNENEPNQQRETDTVGGGEFINGSAPYENIDEATMQQIKELERLREEAYKNDI